MMSDLISRADAIDAIEELPNAYNGWSDAYDKACVIGALEEVPSAEPKTGEWIQKDMCADRFCSECNYAVWDSEAEEYNFCPNCGARMRGEEE